MSRMNANVQTTVEPAQAGWMGLYRAAAICVLLSVGLILLDIAVSFAGGDAGLGEMNATDWLVYFHNHPFLGLRNQGLFNIINLVLALPLYLALYRLHRTARPAGAALALLLFLLGAAVYISNNRALSLMTLSDQYAAAASEAERALLASAGAALLAQGEDFTPGSFAGFLLSNLATLLMIAVMLTAGVFRKPVSLVGLIGSAAMLFFTTCVTFAPATFSLAMLVAMIGGLLMITWNILVALALFRLARGVPESFTQPGPAHRTLADAGR